MCVIGFKPVVVPYDDEVAVAAGVAAFGNADHAVPGGCYRRAGRIAEVNAAVHAPPPPTVVGGYLVVGRVMIAGKAERVFCRRADVPVMDAHNVEILVEICPRHPLEVGEQHSVAVVHVVEKRLVFVYLHHVAQGVFRDIRLDMGGVVDDVELDVVVLLCLCSPMKGEAGYEKGQGAYCGKCFFHAVLFGLGIMPLPGIVLLDVVSGSLRGGGIPFGLMTGSLFVVGGFVFHI